MSRSLRRIAALLLIVGGVAQAKQPLENIERREFSVAPNIAITLQLAEGTVHVYGSNENVIQLTAIKKAYTKERLDGIKVEVTVNGDRASIATTFPPKPTGLSIADRSGTVDYTLVVPQTCSIKQIEVTDGEVIVDGLRGDGLSLRLTNGRILVTNCFASTNLTVGRGGIDVGYFWWEGERAFAVAAQSANGDIHVALPKDAGARFDASTGDGWIHNELAKDGNNDARALQWTMGESAAASFTLRAQSGNLRIDKPY